jgi:hypothetical protein
VGGFMLRWPVLSVGIGSCYTPLERRCG